MENYKIIDIQWKNVYCVLTIEKSQPAISDLNGIYLFNDVASYYIEVNDGQAIINITNVPGTTMLGDGKWNIGYRDENMQIHSIPIDIKLGYSLEDKDKIFTYYKGAYAYLVMFRIDEDAEEQDSLHFFLKISYMQKNKHPEKRNATIEANSFAGAMKKRITFFSEKVLRMLYRLACFTKRKDGKHILFMSETRVPMSGNLRAIHDRIIERGLDYKISYSFFKSLQQSEVKTLLRWIKEVFLLAKQDYIFVDDYAAIFRIIDLDKATKLTQVWHAGVGFKSVGYARFGKDGSPHPFQSGHRKYDYVVVGGDSLIPVYQEVFGLPKEKFLPFGLPRLDRYMDPQIIRDAKEKIYEQYPIFQNKKVILFAPTYRGKGQADAHYPYEMIDLEKINQMCGEEYIFAIKMHPFILDKIVIADQYKNRIIDISEYSDINELFYITDILITDFSSNIFEFSLQRKPIIFYAYDKDLYQLKRGVHNTLDETAPGNVCTTLDEVIEVIRSKDFQIEKVEKYVKENVNENFGEICDKIIDKVILGKEDKIR